MRLKSVQVCEEYDTRFVVERWRFKDVSRERHGRREQLAVRVPIVTLEGLHGGRCGGRYRIKNPEQSIAVTVLVTLDQFGVIEIVSCVHAHACGKTATKINLALRIQKRNLDAIDLARVRRDQAMHGARCPVQIA